MAEPECDGICIMAGDLIEGMSMREVANAHPGCPLHAPNERCGCGRRMCMDCGGPWCSLCGERAPMEGSKLCDTCAPRKCECVCHSTNPPSVLFNDGHHCCDRALAMGYEIATAP